MIASKVNINWFHVDNENKYQTTNKYTYVRFAIKERNNCKIAIFNRAYNVHLFHTGPYLCIVQLKRWDRDIYLHRIHWKRHNVHIYTRDIHQRSQWNTALHHNLKIKQNFRIKSTEELVNHSLKGNWIAMLSKYTLKYFYQSSFHDADLIRDFLLFFLNCVYYQWLRHVNYTIYAQFFKRLTGKLHVV